MIENISTATNAELKKELSELEESFEKNKQVIISKYNELNELSTRYNKVKEEYEKRGGKINE